MPPPLTVTLAFAKVELALIFTSEPSDTLMVAVPALEVSLKLTLEPAEVIVALPAVALNRKPMDPLSPAVMVWATAELFTMPPPRNSSSPAPLRVNV
ncbi:hypothetical protein RSO01_62930 [Reyranella soli]|uniref:Uncharacterized protein n=1 Tax=Reyranella soli TaxID=1230389 RepID=A0A512NJJ6_9HYPH|nr:hypothetical protein RSO01_62930 [Reyranella soli]